MEVMETTAAPTYHALKDLWTATLQPSGVLLSPWSETDTERVYEAMKDFYPEDAKVTAVYPTRADLSTFKTVSGVVAGVSAISIYEPSFHIRQADGFTILLPGSLLSAA